MTNKLIPSIFDFVSYESLINCPAHIHPEIDSYFSLAYWEEVDGETVDEFAKAQLFAAHLYERKQLTQDFGLLPPIHPEAESFLKGKIVGILADIEKSDPNERVIKRKQDHLKTLMERAQHDLTGLFSFVFGEYAMNLETCGTIEQKEEMIREAIITQKENIKTAKPITSLGSAPATSPHAIKAQYRIRFLNGELTRLNEPAPQPQLPMLNWTGNLNQLTTLFLQLREPDKNGKVILDATKEDIKRVIERCFLLSGKPISKSSLDTYFKKQNTHQWAQGDKRLDIESLMKGDD